MTFDPENRRVLGLNDEAARLLGPSSALWIGRSLSELLNAVASESSQKALPAHSGKIACVAQTLACVADRTVGLAILRPALDCFCPTVLLGEATGAVAAECEDRAEQERDLLRGVMSSSMAAITVLDRSGRIVFANPASERILGLERRGILGRSYDDPAWHIADEEGNPLPEERLPFRRVMVENRPILDLHHTIQWPDGRRRLLRISGAPLHDRDGELTGAVFSIEDQTEQRQAELSLRESETRYRQIADLATEGICILDARGHVSYSNRRLAEMLHLDPGALAGQDFLTFVEAEHRPAAREHLASAGRGVVEQIDLRFVRADAGLCWAIVSATALQESRGAFRGTLVMITDISERKRAEEVLQTLTSGTASVTGEDFFHSLVHHLASLTGAHMAFLGELVGPERNRVRSLACWSDGAWQDSIEYPLVGSPCAEAIRSGLCFHGERVREAFPADEVLQQMPVESYLGVRLPGRGGEPLGVMSILDERRMPRDRATESVLKIFAARAAVELERQRAEEQRRLVERRLLEAQKLESLRLMAGGVAHDFNNLLVAILGNVELIRRQTNDQPAIRDYLEQIDQASYRAAELCKQMLAYSGRGRITIEPVDLSRLVRESRSLLHLTVGSHLQLELHLASELPRVLADASQIRQALLNLVINASEAFGPEGGRIQLSTGMLLPDEIDRRRIWPREEAIGEGEHVYLEVADTGCGMSAEVQSRAFEPFFTTKFIGRGLGLSAVMGTVRSHRGFVWLESAPGQGTRVRLLLSPYDSDSQGQG